MENDQEGMEPSSTAQEKLVPQRLYIEDLSLH